MYRERVMEVDIEHECPVCRKQFDDLPLHVVRTHLRIDRDDWRYRMTITLRCWCGFEHKLTREGWKSGEGSRTRLNMMLADHLDEKGVWAHWMEHVMGGKS
jgi:hypothetical protein